MLFCDLTSSSFHYEGIVRREFIIDKSTNNGRGCTFVFFSCLSASRPPFSNSLIRRACLAAIDFALRNLGLSRFSTSYRECNRNIIFCVHKQLSFFLSHQRKTDTERQCGRMNDKLDRIIPNQPVSRIERSTLYFDSYIESVISPSLIFSDKR